MSLSTFSTIFVAFSIRRHLVVVSGHLLGHESYVDLLDSAELLNFVFDLGGVVGAVQSFDFKHGFH